MGYTQKRNAQLRRCGQERAAGNRDSLEGDGEMTDCVLDQAGVAEAKASVAEVKRKRHTRPKGTPTKVLNTPVRVATMEAIKRVAKQHNVGYGEVVDQLVKSAEKAKKG